MRDRCYHLVFLSISSRIINWFKNLDVAKDLSDAKWPILLLLTKGEGMGEDGDGTGSLPG